MITEKVEIFDLRLDFSPGNAIVFSMFLPDAATKQSNLREENERSP
jgi:hypothetical protein